MRDLLESGLCMIEYLRPGIQREGLGVYSGAVRTVVLGPYYWKHRSSAQPKSESLECQESRRKELSSASILVWILIYCMLYFRGRSW